jgi:hypothetical protein
MGNQPRAIRVTRRVAAGAPALSDFLASLDNHWDLCEGMVEVTSLDGPVERPHGASLTLRGPLGIRRAARTRLLGASLNKVWGRARLANGTEARVTWRFAPGRGTTEVELELELRDARLVDRWLFALIRPWVTGQLSRALGRLAEIAAIAAEQLGPSALTPPHYSSTSKESLQ